MVDFVVKIGHVFLSNLRGFRDFRKFLISIILSARSLRHLKIRSLYSTVLHQIKFTGLDALPLISVVALMLGATVIIQASQRFPLYGIESFIGDILVIIIAREIGPLATAVIVISRSGSAIATEVAMQKQNHEIRSLELLGIDTRLYIVVPRIAASIISILSLIVIFDIIAIAGGYIIAMSTVYIPVDQFFAILLNAFSFEDLAITVVKSIMYGLMIPIICCYYGLRSQTSYQIPIFVSKAVVRTLLFVFVINALISILFYL